MLESRKPVILIFFYIIGAIYILRLFYLQIIDSSYRSLGSLNSIRREINVPLRGQVYDRKGKLIVANEEVYDMFVTPKKVLPFDTASFCNLFNVTKSYLDSTIAIAKEYSKDRPSRFLRQLTKEEYASVIDAMIQYPGFTFEQSFFRTYPGNTMANALGYIGEIPQKKFEEQEEQYYRKGDYIGLSGLEKYYENELRGIRGVRFTLMNVKGEEKGQYADGKYDTTAVIGQNLYTSVSLELQQLADSLFKNKVGSVVAIEPSTGEILAIGSYPTYDPSLLSGKSFSSSYTVLSKNPDRPLNNRAISAFYRPGSTFKLVQAAIGLQMGVITPKTSFASSPSQFIFHSGPYEAANLYNAIQLSSNPYFYNVFKKILANNSETNPFKQARVGLEEWGTIVARFGFGKQLGIDLPSESKGVLPDVKRYDKIYGKEQWKFSNIFSLSIGEGEYGVNVLKLANLCATLANRGYWMTPHLVKKTGINEASSKGINIETHKTGIEPRHYEEVIKGMHLVVEAGTGRSAKVEGIEVCGKTGTSQNKKGKDHAIFIAFAPKYKPKIAIAVVVENGGFGGVASAPICGLMIEQYLNGIVKRQAYKEQVMNTSWTTVARHNSNASVVKKPSQTIIE
ncbi:peptidoglycan glycosyltransferase [Lacihabitans sp. LS3-19]|uniref:penicillin-binding transpeptidase domain-containing protein n=1 Tax=Lacihabitans sp. LS3-19 TaxID=2487335 RepID=UPI0020CD65FA|nr:penicillin-binding transpeptidase domain-containing protein [Lacihabitans sp. LS3-19]MCP9767662.1 peptidoglycan glycosyltransferase [Lacihabitans sp. LS3-19]